MLFCEIFAVMAENELSVADLHGRVSCTRVIRILQELRHDMPRALHLLEELVPWASKLRILLQLDPAPGRSRTDVLKVAGLVDHPGGLPRATSSDSL